MTRNHKTSRWARILAGAVVGIAAVGAAPTAQAGSRIDVDVEFRFGGGPSYESRPTRVWVEPVYRVDYDRVWVDPVYRDVQETVWVEPVYREECERVWIDPIYELRPVIRWENGRRVEVSLRVCVQEGRWDTRVRRVLVSPGRWETRTTRVLVCAGYWKTVERRVCVREGYWDVRYERVPVAVPVPVRVPVRVPEYRPPHQVNRDPGDRWDGNRGGYRDDNHRGTIRDADGDRFVNHGGRLTQVDRGDRYR